MCMHNLDIDLPADGFIEDSSIDIRYIVLPALILLEYKPALFCLLITD